MNAIQKALELVTITPPPEDQRVRRPLAFARDPAQKSRYSMPNELHSCSPVGYRTRVSFTAEEMERLLPLLSLERPSAFVEPEGPLTDAELFEESSLGVITARQSTNYRGHRQVTLGPEDSPRVASLLRRMQGLEAGVLDGATHTNVVFARPYRTPFTMLLTFIGHKPVISLATVLHRAYRKLVHHDDDIPSVGYLQQLHIGVLADAMERAAMIASQGRRKAQIFQAPFLGEQAKANRAALREFEALVGLSMADRQAGWRIAFVAQVGQVPDDEAMLDVEPELWRRLGADLLAFRSERIQPGINHEDKAPEPYQKRQEMSIPDELTVQSGRAAYNAFVHWTGIDRERSKDLLLLERIDVLTEGGKERIREVRAMLDEVADMIMKRIPLWADLPTGRAFSRNAGRGKKAFALAGQRIYIGGLDRREVVDSGLDWDLAVRAVGAAAARSALYAELMGVTEVPEGCDLLAGICLMAGPVNQNDIGKTFYGYPDLLANAYSNRDPTSLLVWTLKAKTVADPIGNEEQLMNPKRKGALVDLRPGPHEVVAIRRGGRIEPFRQDGERTSCERAFGDVGNFVRSDSGEEIPYNRGEAWPQRDRPVW